MSIFAYTTANKTLYISSTSIPWSVRDVWLLSQCSVDQQAEAIKVIYPSTLFDKDTVRDANSNVQH